MEKWEANAREREVHCRVWSEVVRSYSRHTLRPIELWTGSVEDKVVGVRICGCCKVDKWMIDPAEGKIGQD